MVLVFGWLTPVGLETETACARSLIFNGPGRSEEHTSELQSQSNLVCRLLLEKKKQKQHLPRRYQVSSGLHPRPHLRLLPVLVPKLHPLGLSAMLPLVLVISPLLLALSPCACA